MSLVTVNQLPFPGTGEEVVLTTLDKNKHSMARLAQDAVTAIIHKAKKNTRFILRVTDFGPDDTNRLPGSLVERVKASLLDRNVNKLATDFEEEFVSVEVGSGLVKPEEAGQVVTRRRRQFVKCPRCLIISFV